MIKFAKLTHCFPSPFSSSSRSIPKYPAFTLPCFITIPSPATSHRRASRHLAATHPRCIDTPPTHCHNPPVTAPPSALTHAPACSVFLACEPTPPVDRRSHIRPLFLRCQRPPNTTTTSPFPFIFLNWKQLSGKVKNLNPICLQFSLVLGDESCVFIQIQECNWLVV